MKIAFITDTHCGVRNNSQIFLNNAEKFYSETFFPEIKKRNIDTVIHGGDIFDNRKSIDIRSLTSLKRSFLDKLKSENIKMYVILGNHDTYYKNSNDVNSVELLLSEYDNIKIISQPETIDFDGTKIDFIPWIASEDKHSVNFIKKTSSQICVGHFDIVGFEMEKGILSSHGLDKKLFQKYDMVLSGHYHNKSNQGNITYPGAPLEFTWNDEGISKYFHILDTSKIDLEPVKNDFTLFKKIYYNDDNLDDLINPEDLSNHYVKLIVIKQQDQKKLNAYIDKIQKSDILDLKIIENFVVNEKENDDEEQKTLLTTEEIIYNYLENIETESLDKAVLKKHVHALYNEAQLLSI